MFTGLIEGVGRVARITPQGADALLMVTPPWETGELVMGESIAVDGACLTVSGISAKGFSVAVSTESLDRTTLGRLLPGAKVNLERAMRLGERLGGHLVTGHVDCVGTVSRRQELGSSTRLSIGIPPEHIKFIVEKGSVALNGISLTVNQITPSGFELNIIPHTREVTTLDLVKQGDSVNIETDLIGKYVARLLNHGEAVPGEGEGLTKENLFKMGFSGL